MRDHSRRPVRLVPTVRVESDLGDIFDAKSHTIVDRGDTVSRWLGIDLEMRMIATRAGDLACSVNGDGAPLLLLQRFRGTMDDWDPAFVEALARTGRQVIRFDSIGIGRSGGVTPQSVVDWADAALALADALNLTTFDVLGWSMGGMVAQWMALKAPDRLRRLVLAATSPGLVTEEKLDDPRVAAIRLKDQPSEDDYLYLFFSHGESGRRLGSEVMARCAAEASGPPVSNEAFAAQMAAQKRFVAGPDATRPRLPEIRTPILVANGSADVMQPPFGSYAIARTAPDARLILYPDAGHAFLFQHRNLFVGDVHRFLTA